MNKWAGLGRLVRDPEIRRGRTSKGEEMLVARYTLAIDRRGKDAGADFISCVVFGKGAEFAEKYLKKGTKIAVTGHIQTGDYTNKDGQKVYTTDVIIEEQEFAESKAASGTVQTNPQTAPDDEFVPIPDNLEDALPFR